MRKMACSFISSVFLSHDYDVDEIFKLVIYIRLQPGNLSLINCVVTAIRDGKGFCKIQEKSILSSQLVISLGV